MSMGVLLSELIDELQSVRDNFGDMPVFLLDGKNKPMIITGISYPTFKKECVIKLN